jgi:CRP-like cAMP-binding protein
MYYTRAVSVCIRLITITGDIAFKKGEELTSFYLLLSGIVRATDLTAEQLLQSGEREDAEMKAVDEVADGGAISGDEADPMGHASAGDSIQASKRTSFSASKAGGAGSTTNSDRGKSTAESRPGSVVGFAKTASIMGSLSQTIPILSASRGKDRGSEKAHSTKSNEGEGKRVSEAVVRDFLKDDFALLPGGYLGADALLLGKSVCPKTYLAIREATFLEITREFFNTDLFENVRKDLEVELAIQEKAEDSRTVLKQMSSKSKPIAREYDELGEEEDDIPAPEDGTSSGFDYDCYIM